MGTVLQQRVQDIWQPLAFFSRKMNPAQQKYSAYDRELMAIYEAVLHFRHMLEARHFTTLRRSQTAHLRLPPEEGQALHASSTTWISSHNSSDIRHISGRDNIVADTLSRVEVITVPVIHEALPATQADDEELREL
jgi:cleavage and polyadenylation specificity factor subunit 1